MAVSAQTAPQIEVTSIKPSPPGSRPTPPGAYGSPGSSTGHFRFATLKTLVAVAFGLLPQRHDPEPAGGPEWADQNQYDVEIKMTGIPTVPQGRAIVLAMLEDRFKLRWHKEPRDTPVYALVYARADRRLGDGLKPSKLDCRAFSDTLAQSGKSALAREQGQDCGLSNGGAGGAVALGQVTGPYPRGAQLIHGTATMRELLAALSRAGEIDRPVVDRTGLTGTFDFDLTWVPFMSGAIVADRNDVVSIFTTIQQQLGLKLEARREPRDVIVIDSAELPTPD